MSLFFLQAQWQNKISITNDQDLVMISFSIPVRSIDVLFGSFAVFYNLVVSDAKL